MSIQERILKNSIFGIDFKIFLKENDPFFLGKEVATSLRFRRPENAIANHVKDKHKMTLGKLLSDLPETRRSEILSKLHPSAVVIDELAFYNLCLRSSHPDIEPFQEWVYESIRDIRKGNIPTLESLSLQDNPMKVINKTIPYIPEYKPKEANGERKGMHDEYGKGFELSKNPKAVAAGGKGGKKTQKEIREMRDFIENFQHEAKKILKK